MMKRKILHIIHGIKGVFVVLFTFLLYPLARLILIKRKIWIVAERKCEARDNGYSFFKYMRDNHKDINCYYVIDFQSKDYGKVSALGNCIRFGSLKHFFYFCGAKYLIASATEGFCPSYYLTLLRKKMHLAGKYVFLQHGITKDDQKFLYKKRAKIDLFVCGAKPEFDDISKHYGYKENEVAYTGFSRFDEYHNLTTKNKILIMPTWRRGVDQSNILNSDYYKAWMELINSKEINDILKSNNIVANFYIHPLFQKYSEIFVSKCSNIKVINFNNCDLQQEIRESSILITDFSSVFFDFAYMEKPTIYYQFDEEMFFKSHYQKGYFDYRKDGFGPVCSRLGNVVDNIKTIINNNCNLPDLYKKRIETFFPIRDNNNSKRIYDSITNI